MPIVRPDAVLSVTRNALRVDVPDSVHIANGHIAGITTKRPQLFLIGNRRRGRGPPQQYKTLPADTDRTGGSSAHGATSLALCPLPASPETVA